LFLDNLSGTVDTFRLCDRTINMFKKGHEYGQTRCIRKSSSSWVEWHQI